MDSGDTPPHKRLTLGATSIQALLGWQRPLTAAMAAIPESGCREPHQSASMGRESIAEWLACSSTTWEAATCPTGLQPQPQPLRAMEIHSVIDNGDEALRSEVERWGPDTRATSRVSSPRSPEPRAPSDIRLTRSDEASIQR